MSEPHLHNKIGDAVRDCKQRLYKRLKDGANVEDAIAQFIGEIRLALQVIAENVNRGSVPE